MELGRGEVLIGMSTWAIDVSAILVVIIVLQVALDRANIPGMSKMSQVFISYIPDEHNLQILLCMLKYVACC